MTCTLERQHATTNRAKKPQVTQGNCTDQTSSRYATLRGRLQTNWSKIELHHSMYRLQEMERSGKTQIPGTQPSTLFALVQSSKSLYCNLNLSKM